MLIDLDHIVRRTRTVSSLPMVYARISDAMNDPSSSNRDIANIISEDAGLTARLLRLSNSAFYGFQSKIDTINRAVALIGSKQLFELVIATSVVRLFKGVSADLVSMESFWRHSVACGVAARILATYRRETNVERFFVAGLLHDIGRMLMFSNVPELGRKALMEADARGALLHRVELEILGVDHATIGGALLKHWQLPEQTVNAVAFHHRPDGSEDYETEAAIVHVADIIANSMGMGSSGERFVPPLSPSAWDRLGLSVSVLSPVLKQLRRQYREAIAIIMPAAFQ